MPPSDRPRGRPVVVVTGMGVLSSLGQGLADNWAALTQGRSGIRTLVRFPIDGLRTSFGGTVDFLPLPEPSAPALCERLAELAIEEAVAQSGLGTLHASGGSFPGPLFIAMPPVELDWPQRLELAAAAPGADPAAITYADLLRAAATGRFRRLHERFLFSAMPDHLADRFGTRGSPVGLSTACASGATAIQLGLEAIRRGETEAAICAGTDASVTPEGLIRFSLLSALSTRNDDPAGAARPFSRDRDGFVMAEGAGALVLESLDHARARGARVLAVIEGSGERADSFHRTRTSPDGKPVIATLERALADAGIGPDEVDTINAHGTGTPENDKMEWHAVAAVFGERAGRIPISANKSMIGHTLSAAGAIEAVFTVTSLREGRLPPTINYQTPDPALPVDCVPNVARVVPAFRAISNSFGFGGQNVCLVIAAEPR